MTTSISLDAIASSDLNEEIARADIYGLLAQLFYAPASAELLEQLRTAPTQAPTAGAFLELSWSDLVESARSLDNTALHNEYAALFGGMSKPEVYLFGSHYLSGFLNEKPVVRLRHDLAELGLARDPDMPETEDHISYLCEVMRYLIAGDDVAVANLTHQRQFFGDHIQPWINNMCDDLSQHPKANFYAKLAEFTRAFASVESQGFDILA
jgi:TorA maturation chaperone TorD